MMDSRVHVKLYMSLSQFLADAEKSKEIRHFRT